MFTSVLRRFACPLIYSSVALALLGVSFYLATTGALADSWGALDLLTFRIFFILLLVMTTAAVAITIRKRHQDGLFPIFLPVSALALLISTMVVYLFRFEGTMIMAEGEAYEPIAAAYSDIRKGPLARVPAPAFVLASIAPAGQPAGFTIIPGPGGRTLASRESVLAAEGVELSLLKRGVMPLIELTAVKGGTIAREYVRLDLDSPIGQDSFMFVNNPYEFTVRRIKDAADPGGVVFQIAARRGKLKITEGKVDMRTPLKVDAFMVTMPEVKRSAIFQVRRYTGKVFFIVCCTFFFGVHFWSICCYLRSRKQQNKES